MVSMIEIRRWYALRILTQGSYDRLDAFKTFEEGGPFLARPT